MGSGVGAGIGHHKHGLEALFDKDEDDPRPRGRNTDAAKRAKAKVDASGMSGEEIAAFIQKQKGASDARRDRSHSDIQDPGTRRLVRAETEPGTPQELKEQAANTAMLGLDETSYDIGGIGSLLASLEDPNQIEQAANALVEHGVLTAREGTLIQRLLTNKHGDRVPSQDVRAMVAEEIQTGRGEKPDSTKAVEEFDERYHRARAEDAGVAEPADVGYRPGKLESLLKSIGVTI